VPFALVGAALLWVGWFGFNAGSALAANGTAGMAVLVTQVATAAAALSWMSFEWAARQAERARGRQPARLRASSRSRRPPALRDRPGALLIGCSPAAPASSRRRDSSGFRVRRFARRLRRARRRRHRRCRPDRRDRGHPGGAGLPEGVTIGAQVWIQAKSVLFTAAWSGVGTFLILKLLDCREWRAGDREQEVEGLDLALHDERAYNH
jgi:Amt family ammonium transporter